MRMARVRYDQMTGEVGFCPFGAPEFVIGSELFVRELAAAVLDPVRARRKRLARGHSPDAPPLFAYRRLDPAHTMEFDLRAKV